MPASNATASVRGGVSFVGNRIKESVVGLVVQDRCLEAEDVGGGAEAVDAADAGLCDH